MTQKVFLIALGGSHEDASCDTLQEMAPTNVNTVDWCTNPIESKPDRLELVTVVAYKSRLNQF